MKHTGVRIPAYGNIRRTFAMPNSIDGPSNDSSLCSYKKLDCWTEPVLTFEHILKPPCDGPTNQCMGLNLFECSRVTEFGSSMIGDSFRRPTNSCRFGLQDPRRLAYPGWPARSPRRLDCFARCRNNAALRSTSVPQISPGCAAAVKKPKNTVRACAGLVILSP